jgi:hypothetical protein
MNTIVLPILFNSEIIQQASDAGLEYDMKDCIIRNVIFIALMKLVFIMIIINLLITQQSMLMVIHLFANII